MGKHEKGTPKEIANRTKSKGMQKLRFFCQMCQKQCRDQNGFKCHLTSESHQRQLLLFAENSTQYLNQYSGDFEKNFMQLLRTQYGTKRVRANEVYNEYIRDKSHVHMNATHWHSLSGFVQYLGKSGKCKIDECEKGWYITYIDKEAELQEEESMRKAKQERTDEERQLEMLDQIMLRELEKNPGKDYVPTELNRNDEDEKISINMNRKPTKEELNRPHASSVNVFEKVKVKKEESKERARDRESPEKKKARMSSSSSSSKRSTLDEIKEQEERRKEAKNRKDYWLHEGIIVKIVTKDLGSSYYKEKGVVKKVIDNYSANVKLDDGTTVKLDQSHVETVIPAVGRSMLVVNGAYRGSKAVLEKIDHNEYCVHLTLSSGPLRGRSVVVPYEDASKLA